MWGDAATVDSLAWQPRNPKPTSTAPAPATAPTPTTAPASDLSQHSLQEEWEEGWGDREQQDRLMQVDLLDPALGPLPVGQPWSAWTGLPGDLPSPSPTPEQDHCGKLPREDMRIFGRFPKHDLPRLCNCRKCGLILKRESFLAHMELRHRRQPPAEEAMLPGDPHTEAGQQATIPNASEQLVAAPIVQEDSPARNTTQEQLVAAPLARQHSHVQTATVLQYRDGEEEDMDTECPDEITLESFLPTKRKVPNFTPQQRAFNALYYQSCLAANNGIAPRGRGWYNKYREEFMQRFPDADRVPCKKTVKRNINILIEEGSCVDRMKAKSGLKRTATSAENEQILLNFTEENTR